LRVRLRSASRRAVGESLASIDGRSDRGIVDLKRLIEAELDPVDGTSWLEELDRMRMEVVHYRSMLEVYVSALPSIDR